MDFINLELAAQPGEERQAGDEILPAEDPDWTDVKEKALAVLGRSHDLRAAVHLAQAALYTDGLTAFADVTGYMRSVVEEFWDSVHPQLDPDDDNDPTARINALQNLAGSDTVLRALRRAPLAESRGFGVISLRDIQVASGEVQGSGDGPDSAAISAAFQDSDKDDLRGKLAAIQAANDNVKAIDAAFSDRLPGQGPNYDDLVRVLRSIAKTLGDHVGDEGAVAAMGGDAPAAMPSGGGGAASSGGGMPGAVNSLADVHSALDKIMAFYARSEPSSPVPLMLARAKKLVGADFMTIMKDMAPNGLDNVRLIGGLSRDDDY